MEGRNGALNPSTCIFIMRCFAEYSRLGKTVAALPESGISHHIELREAAEAIAFACKGAGMWKREI